MYKDEEKNVIMCVISKSEVREIRQIVSSIDKNAFTIVTETKLVQNGYFK